MDLITRGLRIFLTLGMFAGSSMAVPQYETLAFQPTDLVAEVAPCAVFLDIGTAAHACVLFLHLVPDAPAVDVWIDNQKFADRLEFKDNSGYLGVAAGKHDLVLVPAGSEVRDAIFEARLDLESGRVHHAVAAGTLASWDAIDFGMTVYDRSVGQTADGSAIVEFIQMIHPAVNLHINLDRQFLRNELEWLEVSDDFPLSNAYHFVRATTPEGYTDIEWTATSGTIFSIYFVSTSAGEIQSLIVATCDARLPQSGDACAVAADTSATNRSITPSPRVGPTSTPKPRVTATRTATPRQTATRPRPSATATSASSSGSLALKQLALEFTAGSDAALAFINAYYPNGNMNSLKTTCASVRSAETRARGINVEAIHRQMRSDVVAYLDDLADSCESLIAFGGPRSLPGGTASMINIWDFEGSRLRREFAALGIIV
jgi:hypothetical protein